MKHKIIVQNCSGSSALHPEECCPKHFKKLWGLGCFVLKTRIGLEKYFKFLGAGNDNKDSGCSGTYDIISSALIDVSNMLSGVTSF